jgi:hypothetical protein
MTSDRAEQRALELLVALGQVAPPASSVLAAAREALWSQVAGELFPAGLTDDPGRTRPSEAPPPARRGRPDRKPRQHRYRGAAD